MDVKRARPAVTEAPGLEAYARWRATTLGAVTEALEQRCILTLVGSVSGRRVLDLGCGDGHLAATLASQRAQAVGIDLDHAALQAAISRPDVTGAAGARFVEGRIERLPFPDGSFDIVTAVTVLCLVSDRPAAVREAARVLRPGGRLIIGDLGRWSAWAARRRIKGWFGSRLWRSAHFWTPAELSRLIEQAGFSVEVIRGSVYYPPIGILARALAPLDRWLGAMTTVGAAFIAVAATKRAHDMTSMPDRVHVHDGVEQVGPGRRDIMRRRGGRSSRRSGRPVAP
jgi:ubiquinone/menaquinone biosynthesis C-methylase UbiE